MKRCMGHPHWAAWGAALVLTTGSPAHALERVSAYVDLGLGASRTQPFVTGGAACGTIGLGASARLLGFARAHVEFRATAGRDFPSGIPEAANAGDQSLVIFLGALEFVNRGSLRGPFLASGLGVGHSTISGARGPTDSPNFGFVPLHDRTALAFGLGVGYRFAGGPGPMHTQVALQAHGMLREGMTASAYATAITLGFAY